MKNIKNNQRGSIALISILIVSAILLILVLGTSESQISTSYQQLNSNSNKYSYYISEACLEDAVGRIKRDANYNGGTTSIGDGANCEVEISGNNPRIITVTTTYMNYTNSYQAQISVTTNGQANNIRLLNWEKI